jgi:hypothetical protein
MSSPNLPLSSSSKRSAVFLPIPGTLTSRPASCKATAWVRSSTSHAAEDGQRRARPHAGYLDEFTKRRALARRGKAIQQLRILAHDELREQAHRLAHRRQVVERAHGHLHLVAHAVAVHQHLGRVLFQQLPVNLPIIEILCRDEAAVFSDWELSA